MVGARAPGTEQISQLASYFFTFLIRTKRRKMIFFEGYPVGWGGYKGSGGGVQGLWFGGVGHGRGGGVPTRADPKEGETPRLGLGGGPRASVPAG